MPCAIGCVTCSSENVCSSCEDSTNEAGDVTRSSPSTGCQCLDGYYDVNDVVCETCDYICLTCEGSNDVCTSCDEDGNFELQGSTCVCKPGFYLLDTGSSATCEPCDSKCLTCETSPIFCTSCSEEDFRELKGTADSGISTCACIEGFAEFYGQCYDKDCDTSVPFCQTCLLDVDFGTTECLTCGGNRVVVNGFCECEVGYFENDDGECERCGSGCQYCLSASQCSSCAIGSDMQPDGSCKCRAGFVIDESAGTLFCRKCAPGCSACEGSYDSCTACKSDHILDETDNTCVCPEGLYAAPLPSGDNVCRQCINNCVLCTDSTDCTECAENFVWDEQNKICVIDCPYGTYDAGSKCEACPE